MSDKDIEFILKSATAAELERLRTRIDRELADRREPVPAKAAAAPAAGGRIQTFTDGASRGNPGKAGIGVLICDGHGKTLREACRFIGVTTNNEAEYRALILALHLAAEYTPDTVDCYMDSQLVARQLMGQYAVKSEKMIPLWQEARALAAGFKKISFHHVPREHPLQQIADKLANRGIDEARA